MEAKSFLTLTEAQKFLYNNKKKYVRNLLETTSSMCINADKLSVAEWNSIVDYTPDNTETLVIFSKEYAKDEIMRFQRILRGISYMILGCLSAHDKDNSIEISEIEQTLNYLIRFT